jgi:DNA-binding beta-propeller fold protein YncE
VLSFNDLQDPSGAAVDAGGAVYVTDFANNKVLKLPVR